MNSLVKCIGGFRGVRLILTLVLVLGATFADASHFRFGHFTYKSRQDVAPAAAEFSMTVAFRASAFGYPNIGQTFRPGSYSYGDGSSANLRYKVIARNLQEDWIVGRAIDSSGNELIRHNFPAVNNNGNPWLAQFSSCCKIGAIRNAANASWRVYTRVDLANGNSSPISNLPPIVTCSKFDCRFLIPAVDPDRDNITWRMSTRSESAIPSIPSGMHVDRDTGIFTWAGAASFFNGLYSVQVTLEDRDEAGSVKSTTAIDFLIRLQDQGANKAPVFDHPPTPAAGSVIKAVVGQKLSIPVQASDADDNDIVYLNHVGIPSNATFVQTIAGGQLGLASLEWTPDTSDIGEHIVTFLANDNRGGASSPVSITLEVIKPAISDVKVTSVISATDIEIDTSSFSHVPASISIRGETTLVTWEFDTFSVDQVESLSKDLKLYNVEPGERRLVTERLDVSYTDIDGNSVHQELPEQLVSVAPTLTNVSVSTDKQVYGPSEQIIIGSSVGNLADVETDARVSIIITDGQQNIAADFGVAEVIDMQPGEQRAMPNHLLDSSSIYSGGYLAIARLVDSRGKVLRQSSSPFSVTTRDGEFFNLSALVGSDKPVYQSWDQSAINLRVVNIANKASFAGGSGLLSVYRPNGELLATQEYAINSLAPTANEYRQYMLRLEDREAGTYRLVWQVKQGGETLAESRAIFDVERVTLSALVGNVEIESYETGEPQNCQFVTTNRSLGTDINVNLLYQVVSLDSGDVLYEVRENSRDINRTESHPYQMLLSDPPAYGDYGCILLAEVDEELRQLAAAGFKVTPPRLEIRLKTAGRGRLLVLLDSDDYPAPHDDATPSFQREYLEALLTQHGWTYTITDDATNFTDEFNSGGYSAIALLSEAVSLAPEVERLMVEANNNGVGLLIAGSWNRRNSQLERSLGIALTGRNNSAGSIELLANVVETPVSNSQHVGEGLALAHCGADVWAVFSGGKNASNDCAFPSAPAAVSFASYGQGRNVYFAYDLLDVSSQAQVLHEQLLLEALIRVQPYTWPVAAGRIIPVELTIENQSRRAAVDVLISLPNGGSVVDASAVQRLENGSWLWQQDFSAPAVISKIFYIQLPEEAVGSLPLLVDIDAGINRSLLEDDSDISLELGPIGYRLPFGSAEVVLQSLIDQYPGDKDYKFIDKKISSAKSDIENGKNDNAVKSLLLVADDLEKKEVALAADLRLIVGQLLYQLQRYRSTISLLDEG